MEARAARWTRILESAPGRVLVAADDSVVMGWASTESGRDADAPRPRELEGIYVLASAHGTGVGQSLHDAAVGTDPADLWMADDNPRAESFYRRNGFTRDGATKQVQRGPVLVDVVRMVR
ncbi:GNAT family N-acetyltransferase [Clavibacter sp. MX14-G9D]|uniref:GNAT family N-acetyltransferase n=1 Tax=Clavibacter sp. MX14-G9D TaxID=3064656 RepID=UPI00293F2890|nr:GNAT family N-acetyltransferase [Clavibacter sp. MX14-G9D]